MKQRKRTVSLPALALSFLLTLVICYFAGDAFVYALPEPVTGWVEVQCSNVPDNFSASATAVFSNTETGETYTITCQKINGYLARMKVPAGKYQVDHVSTADNFNFEAFTDVAAFEITESTPAAQLIPINIIRHDAPELLPPTDNVAETPSGAVSFPDPSEPEPETDSSSLENPESLPDEDNAVLNIIDEMAKPDTTKDQEEIQDPSKEQRIMPSVGKVCLVLFGSGVFAAIVFVCVWVLRKHLEEQ